MVWHFLHLRWRAGYRFFSDAPAYLRLHLEDLGSELQNRADDQLEIVVSTLPSAGWVGTLYGKVFLHSDQRWGFFQHSLIVDEVKAGQSQASMTPLFALAFELLYGRDRDALVYALYNLLSTLEDRVGAPFARRLFLQAENLWTTSSTQPAARTLLDELLEALPDLRPVLDGLPRSPERVAEQRVRAALPDRSERLIAAPTEMGDDEEISMLGPRLGPDETPQPQADTDDDLPELELDEEVMPHIGPPPADPMTTTTRRRLGLVLPPVDEPAYSADGMATVTTGGRPRRAVLIEAEVDTSRERQPHARDLNDALKDHEDSFVARSVDVLRPGYSPAGDSRPPKDARRSSRIVSGALLVGLALLAGAVIWTRTHTPPPRQAEAPAPATKARPAETPLPATVDKVSPPVAAPVEVQAPAAPQPIDPGPSSRAPSPGQLVPVHRAQPAAAVPAPHLRDLTPPDFEIGKPVLLAVKMESGSCDSVRLLWNYADQAELRLEATLNVPESGVWSHRLPMGSGSGGSYQRAAAMDANGIKYEWRCCVAREATCKSVEGSRSNGGGAYRVEVISDVR